MGGSSRGSGGGSVVAGGMNLSTPTVAGPNGMQTLGLPQTSQLSGLQSALGSLLPASQGGGNYNLVPSHFSQMLQNLQGMQGQGMQQGMQQPQTLFGMPQSGGGAISGLLDLISRFQ